MRNAWTRCGWVGVLGLVVGCGGQTLDAGGASAGGTEAGVHGEAGAEDAGSEVPDGGSLGSGGSFDAGTAGEAIELAILDVLAPPSPVDGECSYTADPNQPSLTSGTVDLAYASLDAYEPEVLVQNLNPGPSSETNRVVVGGTTTKITDATGEDVVSLLEAMCSGEATGRPDVAACETGEQLGKSLAVPLDPFSPPPGLTEEVGFDPSYGAVPVTLVDGSTVALLRAYVVNAIALNGAAAFQTTFHLLTYTVVYGVALGGARVASDPYEFPVTVTFGSLVSNLEADAESAVGYCLDTSVAPTTAQACVPGQDTASAAASVDDPAVPTCPTPTAPDAG